MSTAPSGLPRLYPGQRMTAEEFLAVGETEERYELVDGVVIMSPSPSELHQLLLMELGFQLRLQQERGAALVVLPDTDRWFAGSVVYRPDLSVYSTERFRSEARFPPELIVEILSPSNPLHDLVTKKRDYERAGVGAYIVVDWKERRLHHYVRQEERGAAGLVERIASGPVVGLSSFAGVSLDLDAILRLIDGYTRSTD